MGKKGTYNGGSTIVKASPWPSASRVRTDRQIGLLDAQREAVESQKKEAETFVIRAGEEEALKALGTGTSPRGKKRFVRKGSAKKKKKARRGKSVLREIISNRLPKGC